MKKVAVLYSKYIPLIDAIKSMGYVVDCYTSPDFNPDEYDLVVSAGYKEEVPFNTIKSHLSLLPAFEESEPVKDAFLAGVKVTGVTIFLTKSKRIIAQYPVFIHNDAHYEELKQELEYIEQTLFPIVIDKILKNEPFECRTLLNTRPCGGCKGCSK